eukprot:jgi/Mesvir1/29745/Mv05718-RA.1
MRDWAYNLVLDTLAKERWKILFERKQLQDPTYTLHQFYMEHPDHRPLTTCHPRPLRRPPSPLTPVSLSGLCEGERAPFAPWAAPAEGAPCHAGVRVGFPPGAREQQEEEEESGGEGQSRPRKRGGTGRRRTRAGWA